VGSLCPEAHAVWTGLESRRPALLRFVEPLGPDELLGRPPDGGNSVAWPLRHVAEVEDNWVRRLRLGASKRRPFGVSRA
jgi:hypothetical protein